MRNIFKSKWGKWYDLGVGYASFKAFILQFRRHQNGKIQFRVVQSESYYGCELDLKKLKELER